MGEKVVEGIASTLPPTRRQLWESAGKYTKAVIEKEEASRVSDLPGANTVEQLNTSVSVQLVTGN